MVLLTPLISDKAVAHGAVLSLIDDHHKITIRIPCAAYGVICAVPVKASDEYVRRKHLWGMDPTGIRDATFQATLRRGFTRSASSRVERGILT